MSILQFVWVFCCDIDLLHSSNAPFIQYKLSTHVDFPPPSPRVYMSNFLLLLFLLLLTSV